MATPKLFIIDGHALCYRSFYAIREMMTSKGQATNAVFGFINTLKKLVRDYKPEYLAVCFDSPQKTKRQEKYASYKIHRPKMPDQLIEQIPLIKKVTKAFDYPIFEFGGFEADDIIATLARKYEGEGLDVVIVTEDKDMFQLSSDKIKFYSARKDAILGEQEIKDKFGINPKYIADYIALAGDKSDNIPGVAGIGAVSAAKLITEFGPLENILAHIDDIASKSIKEKMLKDKDNAILSKELAVLDLSVPLECDLKMIEVGAPNQNDLFELFSELEFRKWAKELAPSESESEEVEIVSCADPSKLDVCLQEIKKTKSFIFRVFENDAPKDLFDSAMMQIGCAVSGKFYSLCIEQLSLFKDIFEDKAYELVLYNLKENLRFLDNCDIQVKARIFDVQLAGYLLSLSSSAIEISDLVWNYYNGAIVEDNRLASELSAMQKLVPHLVKGLEEKSLKGLFEDIEVPLSYVLYKMETQGVNLDIPFLEVLSKECKEKIETYKIKLFKMAGEEFNLNSPKQLSRILFEKLELPVIKKTKTGFSTNEEVLTILGQQHEFPALIIEYRQLAKLVSTYIDAFPRLVNEKTGRLHAQFDQTGTETGRLSSRQPNLQNIPIRTDLGRQIRKAIIPSDEKLIFVSADYSQIELRILAHLSQDENLMKAFKDGEDIHTFTASLIFDCDLTDVTKDMRYAAKRVNFGIVYGMSAFGLAKDLSIPQKEAQDFIDRYFLRYPKVKTFMDAQIKICEEQGFVTTLLNRRRYLPEINSHNNSVKQFAQRQAINTPVQGAAADLMKLAMVDIDREMTEKKTQSKMLITVHDELVCEVPENELDLMLVLIRERMVHSLELSVPIEVTIKIGKNWLEMKDVK